MNKSEFYRIWRDEIQTFISGDFSMDYVTIHPFGDEIDILKKNNQRPVDCKYVGSYFILRGYLYFVEFEIADSLNPYFKEGIYFSKREDLICSKYISKETYLKKEMLTNWIMQILSWFDKLKKEDFSEKYVKYIEIK